MSDITGDLRVSSASGSISGSGVNSVTDAHSMSGGVDLNGDFATPAQIASTSGSVTLRFTPAASVYVDARSVSGDASAAGLGLTGETSVPHSIAGTLASGGPTVSIRTASGSIRLLRAL